MCNPCIVEGKELLDGYRNLELIANTAPECIRLRTGPNDNCSNCILYTDPNSNSLFTRILLVDCLMGKIKLIEQRSLQATKRSLQNARQINQMKKR